MDLGLVGRARVAQNEPRDNTPNGASTLTPPKSIGELREHAQTPEATCEGFKALKACI